MIGNPYFQWMHLSNCTNLSKSHIEQVMHFECKKKKKDHSTRCTPYAYCFVDLQVSFKFFWFLIIFLFVLERICDRFFNVDYIWVLPHTFIESNLKWIKKKHITISQIYFANMGYYFIESRGKKKSVSGCYLWKVKKKKNEATYLWVTSRHFVF